MSYILSFIVAFGVTFIAGQILVPLLRKWKAGQSIREDGPTWHMSKQGTPTMALWMTFKSSATTPTRG